MTGKVIWRVSERASLKEGECANRSGIVADETGPWERLVSFPLLISSTIIIPPMRRIARLVGSYCGT